jgi:hypothetical protein
VESHTAHSRENRLQKSRVCVVGVKAEAPTNQPTMNVSDSRILRFKQLTNQNVLFHRLLPGTLGIGGIGGSPPAIAGCLAPLSPDCDGSDYMEY